ncbi:hypothetical protein QJS10_CPA09g00052 [Acorus calamus]|uniref:Uncharacterized protein n=1 Tax=Acorus calamus TaxID=4465 RepID=A0AAV9E755_ACOCL|nr:hypothetical protein QJS10_CPA09g00052 [Acorus calamus]
MEMKSVASPLYTRSLGFSGGAAIDTRRRLGRRAWATGGRDSLGGGLMGSCLALEPCEVHYSLIGRSELFGGGFEASRRRRRWPRTPKRATSGTRGASLFWNLFK